jgi:hypothetical protein
MEELPYALRMWVTGRYGMVRQHDMDSNKLYNREHVAVVKLDVLPSGRIRATAHAWVGKGCEEANFVGCVSRADTEGKRYDATVTLVKETQGFETTLFRSYFRQRGLFLFRGSRPLTTAEKNADNDARLFCVKGTRAMPMAFEVPCTSSVLQEHKVFILRPPGGKYLYLWCGSRATECDADIGANLLFSLAWDAMEKLSSHEKQHKVSIYDCSDSVEDNVSQRRGRFAKSVRLGIMVAAENEDAGMFKLPIQQAKKGRREDFWSTLGGRAKHNPLRLPDKDSDEQADWANYLRDAELGLYKMR